MLYFERWDICFYTYIFFTTENSNILLETFTDYLTHNQFRWEVEESFVAMPQSLPIRLSVAGVWAWLASDFLGHI